MGGPTVTDAIARHREDLEALAERDDLRVARYAQALLELEQEGGTE